jgi:hypothetical protein
LSRIYPTHVTPVNLGLSIGDATGGTDYSAHRFHLALGKSFALRERDACIKGLIVPGACAWYTLGSSPIKVLSVLLGLLGLAVIAYIAVPILKTLGVCFSARIQARLMPSRHQSGRRRTRKRRRA